MQLHIHAGLHKTATSSFQEILSVNRDLLEEFGVTYPGGQGTLHHSQWPLHFLRNEAESVEMYLDLAFSSASENGSSSVLISAEDFETFLLEPHHAVRFSNLAKQAGFDTVRWAFVLRDQWSYFNSLYGELCKHGQSLNFDRAAGEVLSFGEISAGWAGNRWRFCFDYDDHMNRLEGLTGDTVTAIRFEDFIGGEHVGACFLRQIFADNEKFSAFLEKRIPTQKKRNERQDPSVTEFQYLCNFLGLKAIPETLAGNQQVLVPMIKQRVETSTKYNAMFRERFSERFPFVSSRFAAEPLYVAAE